MFRVLYSAVFLLLSLCLSLASPLTASVEEVSSTTALDSLRSAADSLSHAADSLARALDSLAVKPAPAPPKPAAAPTPATKKKPWEMGLGLGYTLNRGNSRQTSLVTSLNLARAGERTHFNTEATSTNASSEGGKKTQKAALRSKLELKHSERFFYFSTLDLDHNREAGLDLRVAPGLGAGIAVLTARKVKLNLNLGANPITEYFRGRTSTTRGHYLAIQELKLRFNSRSRLEQSLTFQPRVDKIESYLLNFNLSLSNELTHAFSLKVNLEGKYNSRPPVHVPAYRRQDWMLYTAFSYSLW
ncbi:DUF481 domain-containing protein [bacterium]|nr:DUF481 domain-containing protein [bacterium]